MGLMQLLVLAAGFLLLLQLLWNHWSHRGLRLPPGPRGLQWIRHLNLMGRPPHHAMQELSKRYGPIMLLRFGVVPVVVVSSPEMAKEVLKTQDSVFASRPYLLAGEHLAYNFKDIALTPYGEHWKHMRRICLTELFTARRIDSFLGVRLEELSILVSRLIGASERDEAVPVKKFLSEFTFNIMTRILMSKSLFGAEIDKAREFIQIIDEQAKLAGAFNVSEFIPSALKWIDWNIPRAKKLQGKTDKWLQEMIDEHRVDKRREVQDFTDILLSCFDQEGCRQDDTVKAMIMELIAGGTDTSITAIEWALVELLRHPRVLAKAQEELDAVVGRDRMVQESDFSKLDYLQATIKETFRLHPPVALLLPHMSRWACKVAGYDIPKGATVFVNTYAIGRDPSVWENAAEFLPERFLGDKTVDVRGHDFELLPFGSGRRSCPGMVLGLKTVNLALSNLVHGFNWSFPPGKDGHPMEEVFGVVNGLATPLQAMVQTRLPAQAYGREVSETMYDLSTLRRSQAVTG